jgi:hypothetical protein
MNFVTVWAAIGFPFAFLKVSAMSFNASWNLQGQVGQVSVPVPEPPPSPRPRKDDPVWITRYLALPHQLFRQACEVLETHVGVMLTPVQAVTFLAQDDRAAQILYFQEVETQIRERLCQEFREALFAPRSPPARDDPDHDRLVWVEALVAGYELSEYARATLRRKS